MKKGVRAVSSSEPCQSDEDSVLRCFLDQIYPRIPVRPANYRSKYGYTVTLIHQFSSEMMNIGHDAIGVLVGGPRRRTQSNMHRVIPRYAPAAAGRSDVGVPGNY